MNVYDATTWVRLVVARLKAGRPRTPSVARHALAACAVVLGAYALAPAQASAGCLPPPVITGAEVGYYYGCLSWQWVPGAYDHTIHVVGEFGYYDNLNGLGDGACFYLPYCEQVTVKVKGNGTDENGNYCAGDYTDVRLKWCDY
jgi:hypothetical protein